MEEFDKLRLFFNLIGLKTDFNITLEGNRQIIVYYNSTRIYDIIEIVKYDKPILELYSQMKCLSISVDVYQSYLAKDIVRYLLEHVQ